MEQSLSDCPLLKVPESYWLSWNTLRLSHYKKGPPFRLLLLTLVPAREKTIPSIAEFITP